MIVYLNKFLGKLVVVTFISFLFANWKNVYIQNSKLGKYSNIDKNLQSNTFDIIIIGGGHAGLTAAFEANKCKKKTLLINSYLPLGGITYNIGAIPTKVLIKMANKIRSASESNFKSIKTKKPKINLKDIFREKTSICNLIRKKEHLLRLKNLQYCTFLNGEAKFVDNHTIAINNRHYSAKNIIIAVGAVTDVPPIKGIENCDFLTLTCALDPNKIYKSITIIGGGYLGLELSIAYSRLGIKTRLIERFDRVFNKESKDISLEIERYLKLENVTLYKNSLVTKIENNDNRWQLYIKNTKNLQSTKLNTDNSNARKLLYDDIILEDGVVLLATGIKANIDKLDLHKTKIRLNEKKFISVNNKMQTSVKHIYAIGDCASTPSFACIARKEAQTAVINIVKGNKQKMDYAYFSWVVFSHPQLGGAGMNEREAKKKKIDYDVIKIPLKTILSNLISNEKKGLLKLIINKKNNTLIGARILANEVGDIISLLSFYIKNKYSLRQISEGIYPFLTLSEALIISDDKMKK